MEKIIDIAGKSYRLATNAYTPIAYKQAFGKDYFQDLFTMLNTEVILSHLNRKKDSDLTSSELDVSVLADFDMTFFHRLFWVFAKSANPKILPFEDFFRKMPEFPIQDIGPTLMEMLNQGMTTRKKQTPPAKRVKKSSR